MYEHRCDMEALTSPLEQLELTQYFEWVNGGIRIVGTRIGLEQIGLITSLDASESLSPEAGLSVGQS